MSCHLVVMFVIAVTTSLSEVNYTVLYKCIYKSQVSASPLSVLGPTVYNPRQYPTMSGRKCKCIKR